MLKCHKHSSGAESRVGPCQWSTNIKDTGRVRKQQQRGKEENNEKEKDWRKETEPLWDKWKTSICRAVGTDGEEQGKWHKGISQNWSPGHSRDKIRVPIVTAVGQKQMQLVPVFRIKSKTANHGALWIRATVESQHGVWTAAITFVLPDIKVSNHSSCRSG